MSRSCAVVGAGISGLAAAVRLLQLDPDARIVVYESSNRAGGKILTEHIDGFVVDGGPDAFLSSKAGGLA
ncbi:MAG TPA: NAD(P)-binding protein, partial [Thermomicrobiales bacterium]|nr:NAD(P)-binding protein [Thermomicrobiales bacterium]